MTLEEKFTRILKEHPELIDDAIEILTRLLNEQEVVRNA